jgi:cell division protein FtsN
VAPAAAPPAPATATATPPATRDPAAILAGRPVGDAPVAAAPVKPGSDPFIYFVQAGAYGRAEDAEQQRARLAMLGLSAKVTEREQAGRTVYRVRVGPFDRKEDAEAGRARLESGGVEAALVRMQK